MSGSSLDGLDIAYIEFLENGGKWTGEIVHSECVPYSVEWIEKLKLATSLSALDYQLLHTEYGHYIGNAVNAFIKKYQLHFKVALVASHGHTTFHIPSKKMTAQVGEGGAIAAVIQLPVVTDLRALDVGFGGEGAPIVPIGEKLLLNDYSYFLNLGGIANVSVNADRYLAFDVCAANRVLNMLANEVGLDFDNEGVLARSGQLNQQLLNELNSLAYYSRPVPKSLPNSFGTDEVFPIIKKYQLSTEDALHTYTAHIVRQIKNALYQYGTTTTSTDSKILVTGGGALNTYLIEKLQEALSQIEVVVPDVQLVQYKEAMIMAFIGVLRWREEYNVLSSVTGATRNSVGGAMWMG